MLNNRSVESAILRNWFKEMYQREITTEDLDRAKAWHLGQNPDWNIWELPTDQPAQPEAALSTEEWITALRNTVT